MLNAKVEDDHLRFAVFHLAEMLVKPPVYQKAIALIGRQIDGGGQAAER
jgi:hypothetical protein